VIFRSHIRLSARWIYSHQASTEHFQQGAEFLPLCNRGLGPLRRDGIAHSVRQEGRRYLTSDNKGTLPLHGGASAAASRLLTYVTITELTFLYYGEQQVGSGASNVGRAVGKNGMT
jgi:hypothetical protein